MSKMKWILILVLMVLFSTVAFAQEEVPSEEYEALAERLQAASEKTDALTSYAVEQLTIENQSIRVVWGEIEQDIIRNLERVSTATVTSGDSPNGQGTVTVTVSSVEGPAEVSYTIEAELRYVDGVVYVNAAYTESEGDVPPLPEGWVEIDDTAFYPEYSDLDLSGFRDLFEDEEDEDDPLESIQELLNAANSVTTYEDDMDGTPIEVFNIVLGWEGLTVMLEESGDFSADDPVMGLFSEALADEEELVNISLALDEDDHMIGMAFGFTMSFTDADASQIDPNLQDGTISALIENTEVNEISQINETFDPVEAPEVEL